MNTIYLVLAVAATSAGIFALMMRADRISDRIVGRRTSSDGGSSSPSTTDSSVTSWFGPYGGGRESS